VTRALLRNDVIGDEAESLFRRRVMKFARQRGWRIHYTYDSHGCVPGEFDLRLHRGDRYLCVELKSQHGRLRPEQKVEEVELKEVKRFESHVWRPSDQWEKLLA
jgi:Holliday junction resolvase-like predicted endonuclease